MPAKAGFDLQLFLPYLLNQAAEAASLAFQRDYKAHYGMLRTEWRVLAHLGQYGPMTARAICDRSHLHKTKVSRAVAALAARRFLERATQDSDRRTELLRLTPAGQAAYADLGQVALAAEARLRDRIPPEDWAVLKRCLALLAAPRP